VIAQEIVEDLEAALQFRIATDLEAGRESMAGSAE
jgi:hypothetical protein